MVEPEVPSPFVATRFLHVPVEWVHEAFTDADRLRAWACEEATVEPRPGGLYRMVFASGAPDGVPDALEGEVRTWLPPSAVVLGWPNGAGEGAWTLHLDLAPGLGGTTATLRLAGPGGAPFDPDADPHGLARVWHDALGRVASRFSTLDGL